MSLWSWLFGKKDEPAIPVGTFTIRLGDETVQFQFIVKGHPAPAAFASFVFTPAVVDLVNGTNADILLTAIDQFGHALPGPVVVQSVTSPDARFTVKPIAGGFNVAYLDPTNAATVAATATGQAT